MRRAATVSSERPRMASELPRRIVILLHSRDLGAGKRPYQIWGLAEVWRSWGIDVVAQHGTERFVEADVVVNHVDLTVVPEAYVLHMARYPVAINGRCTDISKRVVSRQLLDAADAWAGPVIVKTDRNYGGELENLVLGSRLGRMRDALRAKFSPRPWRFRRWLPTREYAIFPTLSRVPEDVWQNENLVVEKFLPEREGDLYALRTLALFGDRWISRRRTAASPIVKSENLVQVEDVEPHPEGFAEARRLGLDRGRIDYVVLDGRAVVFDANRTNTMGRGMTPERARTSSERLAPGLRCFWPPA
jgi:hypothetical protein